MRLIDADKIQFSEIDEIGGEYEPYLGCSKRQIDNLPTVEAIPKDQYEARLKADMVAMLEEIDLQFDEICFSKEDEWKTVPEIKAEYKAIIQQKINELPSVTLEPRWIPVSESLPEPNANDGLIARYYLIQNEYEDMLVARYDGIGWEQMYQHEYLEDDVIAWMPLPTPYEPQERSDKE